jgi:proton glutamate symport protein
MIFKNQGEPGLKLKIHTQIIIALIFGIVAGLVLKENAIHIKFIGDWFIRLLKLIIIPLITGSMISGISSIGNIRSLGRIGLKTVAYYMVTTLLAVLVGFVLVSLIQPGSGADLDKASLAEKAESSKDYVLLVIFSSLALGIAATTVGEKAKPFLVFFEALNAVMMKVTDWVMVLAPIGVFALMAYIVGKTGADPDELKELFGSLAKYMTTVVLGLIIHATITLPILVSVFARYSPLRFFSHMFSAVATAFSTASSAATLPISMECLERNAGVSKKVTSFVMPIGATINMDGTALYEAVAAMFIAQAYAVELTLIQQLIIVLTATLASVGAAAIPGAGLITMAIVLKAVGLPLEGIGMILAVDRILDMCRTAVNVWGDSCGAAVIARLEGESLNQKQQSLSGDTIVNP